MGGTKKVQQKLSSQGSRSSVVVPSGDNDVSSGCSSDEGSPRRRLELEDESSQTVLIDPSNGAPVSVSDVRYDPGDHTVSLPQNATSSHMIALPRTLLNHLVTTLVSTATIKKEGDNIKTSDDVGASERMGWRGSDGVDWSRSPSAALASTGVSDASPDMFLQMPTATGTAGNGQSVASLRPGCEFVRLPHPRHGEPALFLCAPPIDGVETNNVGGKDDSHGVSEPVDSVVLYEVQSQMPPSGFGQTWFVGNLVEPNEELLVVTPFDVTFFALRQMATHRMKEKFVSAEDLFMSTSGGDCRWPGWSVAQAQCPSLVPVLEKMKSDAVLSRISDVRCAGDEKYYRFSEEKMGAWLQGKMHRVMNCPAMHALLQLSPADGGSPPVVPIPHAFGVVAEYVVDDLIATAARLCGAPDAGS